MHTRQTAWVLTAGFALSVPCAVSAQTDTPNPEGTATTVKADHEAPIYDSATNANRMTSARFASPEDDARPGEYFFGLAVQAVRRRNYTFAVSMYKVAASWAYKPAEYNLGVIYAQGAGVPVDLPRAMAWLTLAAERNDKHYQAARDLVNSKLSDAQFTQANVIFRQLVPAYGDAVALPRAKARWAQVRASMTGSRVGSLAGNLKVGVAGSGMADPTAAANPFRVDKTAGDILGGNQTDGSIAYQQMVSSNNPYDPKFEWRPDQRDVTVGPLTQIDKPGARSKAQPSVKSQGTPTGHPDTQ